MQGLRPPIFRRYPARQVTGHLGVHRGQTDTETACRKIRRVSRSIERDLEGKRYVQKVSEDKSVVIQMDTTYWGRGFGLMVINDAYRNKILWRKYVRYETIAGYLEGVNWLKEHGFRIYGVS